MLYALICRDKPDALALRTETRPAHVDYLNATGAVRIAGPFLEDGRPNGSLVVIEAESREAAEAWAAGDPYAAAGLFASVEIREWRQVI